MARLYFAVYQLAYFTSVDINIVSQNRCLAIGAGVSNNIYHCICQDEYDGNRSPTSCIASAKESVGRWGIQILLVLSENTREEKGGEQDQTKATGRH